MKPLVTLLLCLLVGLIGMSAHASRSPDDRDRAICDAASEIGAERGVPVEILRALTRTETGRSMKGKLTPWPWTVNMEGAGHWFDTRSEALAFVKKHMKRGARSFDVGCFQINYRWHGDAFESVEAMFDPAENARYAAKFLLELRAEGRPWREAVGRYHSKTPRFANKYKARFDRILASLGPAPVERDLAVALAANASPTPLINVGGGSAVLIGAAGLSVSAPRHPGGVSLAGFSQGQSLLRPARPLFD